MDVTSTSISFTYTSIPFPPISNNSHRTSSIIFILLSVSLHHSLDIVSLRQVAVDNLLLWLTCCCMDNSVYPLNEYADSKDILDHNVQAAFSRLREGNALRSLSNSLRSLSNSLLIPFRGILSQTMCLPTLPWYPVSPLSQLRQNQPFLAARASSVSSS